MNTLLTRDAFRAAVFARDKNTCVLCTYYGTTPTRQSDITAHHLIDRKCFPDGGYYLDNGVTLCDDHHWDAEKGIRTPDQIREAAGIKTILLPPNWRPEMSYDKWGSPYIPKD